MADPLLYLADPEDAATTDRPVVFAVVASDDELHITLDPTGLLENLVTVLAEGPDLARDLTDAVHYQRELVDRSGHLSSALRNHFDIRLRASLTALVADDHLIEAMTAVLTRTQAADLTDVIDDALSDLAGIGLLGLDDEPHRDDSHLEP